MMSYTDQPRPNNTGSSIEIGHHDGAVTIEMGEMRNFNSLSTDAWAVLTEQIVISARNMARNGIPVCDIARELNVSRKALDYAIPGDTWSHLPGSVPLEKIPNKVVIPPFGSADNSPRAILNSEKVREIRARLARGEMGKSLALEFSVHPATISAIKVGRYWSSVD